MQNKESFTYSRHGRADDGHAESIRRSLLLSMRGGFFIVQGEGARGQKEGLQGTQPSAFDYIYCILFVIYPVISLVAFMPICCRCQDCGYSGRERGVSAA